LSPRPPIGTSAPQSPFGSVAPTASNWSRCSHEPQLEISTPNGSDFLHDLQLEPRPPIGTAAPTNPNWRFRPPMVVCDGTAFAPRPPLRTVAAAASTWSVCSHEPQLEISTPNGGALCRCRPLDRPSTGFLGALGGCASLGCLCGHQKARSPPGALGALKTGSVIPLRLGADGHRKTAADTPYYWY
jgi:hypothetical protein